LGGGKVRVDPEFVARLEIGDGSDGKRLSVACDANVDLGPNQVKAGISGGVTQSAAGEKEEGQQQQSDALIHTPSLDAELSLKSPEIA
jgi:hypothetical protein